jgi:hypothetical protein
MKATIYWFFARNRWPLPAFIASVVFFAKAGIAATYGNPS